MIKASSAEAFVEDFGSECFEVMDDEWPQVKDVIASYVITHLHHTDL